MHTRPRYSWVKTIAIICFGIMIICLVALALIGGGFGEKTDLPIHLLERDGPIIFAHRGATQTAVENSHTAMRAARERGYPAVEIDIHLTKDQNYVLFHDDDLQRLTGKPGTVSSKTSAELADLYLIGDSAATEKILLFDTYCEEFGEEFIIYLDFKRAHNRNYATLADSLVTYLEAHNLVRNTIVANGNIWFLTYLEYAHPQINTCLEGLFPDGQYLYPILPKRFKPDFIAGFEHRATSSFIDWLNESGMNKRTITYHVNERNIDKILGWGIDKLICKDGDYIEAYLD